MTDSTMTPQELRVWAERWAMAVPGSTLDIGRLSAVASAVLALLDDYEAACRTIKQYEEVGLPLETLALRATLERVGELPERWRSDKWSADKEGYAADLDAALKGGEG